MNIPPPERWREISPLLDELLDLAGPARQARLESLRAGSPGLADELAALLDHDSQARSGGFLTGAAAAGPGHTDDASLVGQRLGAYVLQAPLGQGGGGSVWRAHREDGRYDGAVAIKLLHLSLMGRAGAERFRREGQILARLVHPHIARLLDAGVTPGGQPYLVIELVEGQRIDQHCDAQRLGIEARLALFDDVLAAVAHAHTHGVIHRDLKPGNILVATDGTVKLLDFGIAKLLDDDATSAESTALTREGGRALTPEYAAPEQLHGEGVTTATDVYALGVLLYQLLCGCHPTAPLGGNAAEALRATLDTDPAPPSRRVHATATDAAALRGSNPQRLQRLLIGDLDTIVLQALRKVPAERYVTVAALAEDLRRHRMHEPVLAQPDTLPYLARKFVRRHRGAVAASGLVSLAIVAGMVGTVWQARQAQQQRRVAEQQAQRALDEYDLASAMSRLVSAALGPVSDKPMVVADVLTRAQANADRQFAAVPRVQAHLLRQLGVMWAEGGDWVRTEALLQASRGAAVRAGDALQAAEADCVLAIVSAYRGDFAQANAQVAAGLAVARASTGNRRSALVECLTNQGSIAETQDRFPAALAAFDEALQVLGTPRIGEQDVLLRVKRATVLGAMGELPRAVAEYDSALQSLQQDGKLDITAYNPTFNNFANLLLHAGQVLRAEAVLRQLLARQQGPGAGRAREPAEAVNHAMALTQLGRTDEAMALLAATLALPGVQANPYVQVRVIASAGENRCTAGDASGCAAHATQLAGYLQAGKVADAGLRRRLLMLQGQLALMAGQTNAAQALVEQAIVQDGARAPASRAVAAHLLAAQVALAQGRLAQAQQQAEQATASARQGFGGFAESRPLGLALRMQGLVAQAAGDAPAARRHWELAAQQLDGALGPDAADARDLRQRLAALGPAQ